MSSPEKKRSKKKLPPPTTSNPSLPDDLILSCLARVSRLHYLTLSLVSKRFRFLLASPELLKARSLLGHTDICLYVCIFYAPNPRWFTLCRNPDNTLTNDTSKKKKKKKPSEYVLARALIPYSPVNNSGQGLVAVGSSIYNIGGSSSSSSVSILDCTTHTWREAPSFRVKLRSLTASVVDQKIYVAGCYKDGESNSFKSSIEVLDTETQIWDPVPHTPWSGNKCNFYSKSSCIDGKCHLQGDRNALAYNSKERRWDLVQREGYHKTSSNSYCEIKNVLYSVFDGVLEWFDTKKSRWRKLKGLVGLPKFPDNANVTLANYGGKIAVLWDKELPRSGGHQTMIWCAEIRLERRKYDDEFWREVEKYVMWGKVEWLNYVLTVSGKCNVVKVLAATV